MYIKQLKGEGKKLLIVDAGDLLFRTNPLPHHIREQLLKKADLIISAFNTIGCDAVNIGDCDLAGGKEYLLKKAKAANFPFLSANLIDKASGKTLFKPYVIKKINGLKIGLFGLITDGFKPDSDLLIDNPFETAKKIVEKLRKRCDLVIGITHLGLKGDQRLAQEVPGINIIVGGHSSSKLFKPVKVNDTIILQVYNRGRYLGRLDLTIRNGSLDFRDASPVNTSQRKEGVESQQSTSSKERETTEAYAHGEKVPAYSNASEGQQKDAGKSQYINALVPMTENIKADPEIQQFVTGYKQYVAELEKSRPVPSKVATAGKMQLSRRGRFATYVSDAACGTCHVKQHQFLKGTEHAHAYQSLVERNQEFNQECIGCHTTGYRKTGGFWQPNLVNRFRNLKNVQCEVCHGKGSKHVRSNGIGNISRKVTKDTCLKCHTIDGSPGFDFAVEVKKIRCPQAKPEEGR